MMHFTTVVGTSEEEGDFCICAVTRGPSDIRYSASERISAMTLRRAGMPENLKQLRMAGVAAESLHGAVSKELEL